MRSIRRLTSYLLFIAASAISVGVWANDLGSRTAPIWETEEFSLTDTTWSRNHFVFFVQDAQSAAINLSGMPGDRPVIAVNAETDYAEIDIGVLTPGKNPSTTAVIQAQRHYTAQK